MARTRSGTTSEGGDMRTITSRSGALLPVLGLGTWEMGERRAARASEVAALRLGFDLGLTLVDTAEMYANGGAEQVVGEAMAGRRNDIFVVTKVLPQNASRAGTVRAAEGSLRRLGTDWIDLYLLHWPGRHPLSETLEAFEFLRQQGKIRHFGLSNFDRAGMEKAAALPEGPHIAANQVLYNLQRRGIERSLLLWCVQRGVAVMAYSPLDQGRLVAQPALQTVAERHGMTPAQIAIAWTLQQDGVVTIPKASTQAHVRANAAVAGLRLSEADRAMLDAAYPAPRREIPLETS